MLSIGDLQKNPRERSNLKETSWKSPSHRRSVNGLLFLGELKRKASYTLETGLIFLEELKYLPKGKPLKVLYFLENSR